MLSGHHHLLSGRIKPHGAGAEDLRFESELGFFSPLSISLPLLAMAPLPQRGAGLEQVWTGTCSGTVPACNLELQTAPDPPPP